MRSRLEARYAAILDHFELPWVYEPRAYASERGQYLPDFEVLPVPEAGLPSLFIEVRPTLDRALLALTQMPIIWASEPDADLLITVPGLPFRYSANGRHGRDWRMDPTDPWS